MRSERVSKHKKIPQAAENFRFRRQPVPARRISSAATFPDKDLLSCAYRKHCDPENHWTFFDHICRRSSPSLIKPTRRVPCLWRPAVKEYRPYEFSVRVSVKQTLTAAVSSLISELPCCFWPPSRLPRSTLDITRPGHENSPIHRRMPRKLQASPLSMDASITAAQPPAVNASTCTR